MRLGLFRVVAVVGLAILEGCASPVASGDASRVYYCIAGGVPVPPPNTFGPKYVTEGFEYAEYKLDETTIAKGLFGHNRCGTYSVSKTAYLRYRVDGVVVEKRFNLSALSERTLRPGGSGPKTLEFFADRTRVQVRILTPVQGYRESIEVIATE